MISRFVKIPNRGGVDFANNTLQRVVPRWAVEGAGTGPVQMTSTSTHAHFSSTASPISMGSLCAHYMEGLIVHREDTSGAAENNPSHLTVLTVYAPRANYNHDQSCRPLSTPLSHYHTLCRLSCHGHRKPAFGTEHDVARKLCEHDVLRWSGDDFQRIGWTQRECFLHLS